VFDGQASPAAGYDSSGAQPLMAIPTRSYTLRRANCAGDIKPVCSC
jgi:hypothetical protein